MIKAIVFFRRRPDVPLPAFREHWRERHAPLIARLPGLRGYVQNVPLGEDAPYDAVAESSFDDSHEFFRSFLDEGARAARAAGVVRYAQCHVRRSFYDSGREPACDAVALTWLDAAAQLRNGLASFAVSERVVL